MIEFVTFTGVDALTPLTMSSHIQAVGRRYPAEFAVLVGSHSGEADHGIFPPIEFVKRFKRYCQEHEIRSAIHLCGSYSRRVMTGWQAITPEIYDLCAGFDRVQVNLHGDAFSDKYIEVSREALIGFAQAVQCQSVILQHRGDWKDIPVVHPKVEYLFDVSAGAGIESFNVWPWPSFKLARMGYAGGLGVMNIDKAVRFANQHPYARLWFDMESQVRLFGQFNMGAAEHVCQQVFGGGRRDDQ